MVGAACANGNEHHLLHKRLADGELDGIADRPGGQRAASVERDVAAASQRRAH
jgi:hypothetical protein